MSNTLTLSQNPDETIEIKQKLSEIKEEVPLTTEQKEKYKDVILTLNQKIKLIDGKLTAKELSILGREQLRNETIEYSPNALNNALNTGAEAAKGSAEDAENFINTSMDKIGGSETGKKAKEALVIAKEKAIEIGSGFSWEKLESLPVIGGLFKMLGEIFGWIKGIFSFGDKVEEIKEKLSSEEIEKTKKEILDKLTERFPGKKEAIEKIVNDPAKVNEKQLSILYSKIKSGEKITIKDIMTTLGQEQLNDILPSEKEIKEKIFNSIKSDLETKLLGEALSSKQEEQLRKTVSEIGINESTIYDLEKEFKEDDKISMANILPVISQMGIESGVFLSKLIYRGVIPTSHIAADFAGAGMDTIKLSIAPLGIFENLKIETLEDLSGSITDEQKAIIIMLLYKKGGLFFKTLGRATETITKVGIESVTSTTVKSIDILKSSFNNDYNSQIKNLEKIANSLGDSKITDKLGVLEDAKNNLNKVIDNYRYINIVNDPSLKSTTDKINKLRSLGLETGSLNYGMSKNQLLDAIQKNYFKADFVKGITQTGGLKPNLTNTFQGFGGSSDLHDFNQKLESIVKSQKNLLTGNKLGRFLGKGLEMINLPDISRLGDRLVFNFKSVEETKVFAELVKRSPEFFGGIMGKLPIISIAGLATMQEGNILENLGEELAYLIPFVGPIFMIGEGTLSGIKSGEYNMENMSTMGAGFLLIGIDTIFSTQAIIAGYAKGGGTGAVKGLAGYMIQPIKDIYGIGRGIAEFGYVSLKGSPVGLKNIATKALEKTKHLKGKVRAVVILGLLGVGGFQLAFADNNELSEYMTDDGIDIEKIKNSELNTEEKLAIFEILFENDKDERFTKDIVYTIENNTLNIISNNKSVQSDWIINSSIIEILKLNPKINFEYKPKEV